MIDPQVLTHYRALLAVQQWQTNKQPLSPDIAEWLLHTKSLTEKLQRICPCLQVEVINEHWQAFAEQGRCWVREVMLKCGDQAWIFAQTILPQATVENVGQEVLQLGNNAIGLWLFPQNPARMSLEWQQVEGLYARRSELRLKGYPIEIKELFLKNFPFNHEANNSTL